MRNYKPAVPGSKLDEAEGTNETVGVPQDGDDDLEDADVAVSLIFSRAD